MLEQLLYVVCFFVLSLNISVRLADTALDELVEVALRALAEVTRLADDFLRQFVAPIHLVDVIGVLLGAEVLEIHALLLVVDGAARVVVQRDAILGQARQRNVLRG